MATKKATKSIVTPIDQRETFVSAAKAVSDSDGEIGRASCRERV